MERQLDAERRREFPDTLEGYRAKFRDAPLGRWTSSFEAGPWPTDTWELRADGTGSILRSSGSGDTRLAFVWRTAGPQAIELRITDWGPSEDDEDEDEEPADAPEDDDWETIRYDFTVIQRIVPWIVMFETRENETGGTSPKFWWTHDYLRFEGDLPPTP